MKSIRMMAVALLLVGLTGVAKAEGETPERALRTEAKMKAKIGHHISNLQLAHFNLEDETVDIHFECNADGEVVVHSVDGVSCVVSEYVSNKLKDHKMYVDESLQGARHHIKVRYVMI